MMSWGQLAQLAQGPIAQLTTANDVAVAGSPAAAAEAFLSCHLWPSLQLQGWCKAEGDVDLQLLCTAFPLATAQLVQHIGALGGSCPAAPPSSSLFGHVVMSLTGAVDLLVGQGAARDCSACRRRQRAQ